MGQEKKPEQIMPLAVTERLTTGLPRVYFKQTLGGLDEDRVS